jgi:hypothetical protein
VRRRSSPRGGCVGSARSRSKRHRAAGADSAGAGSWVIWRWRVGVLDAREYVQIFKNFHRFLQVREAAQIEAPFGVGRDHPAT